MDEARRNAEIEKLANLMVHDGISPDEQDPERLAPYRDMAAADCGVDAGEAMSIVYETLLFRKMKGAGTGGDILEKGGEFGAGFS